MTNYLYEIPTKVIADGSGTVYPQRQVLEFSGATVYDDPINQKTIVYTSGGSSATLSQILTNGNSAESQSITGLLDPTFDQDAATKHYVDINSGGNLAVTLAKGNDADGYKITGLLNPTLAQDAATKSYVDNLNKTTYEGTIPTGSDTYLIATIATSNSLLNLKVLNKTTKRWATIDISTDGVGYFNYADDFTVYTDRTRLLTNTMELRIVTDVTNTYIYIWKLAGSTVDYKIVVDKTT
jgi:hypothetical protein